jgi:hypothetical protein
MELNNSKHLKASLTGMPSLSVAKRKAEFNVARVAASLLDKSLYVQSASSRPLLNVLWRDSARFMHPTGAFSLILIALSKILLSLSLPRLCSLFL